MNECHTFCVHVERRKSSLLIETLSFEFAVNFGVEINVAVTGRMNELS